MTPTISVPLPVLQRWLSLAKMDGVNSKAKIGEIVDKLIKQKQPKVAEREKK